MHPCNAEGKGLHDLRALNVLKNPNRQIIPHDTLTALRHGDIRMDLKTLRYFTEIVRHGSFGKAAKAIPLSQPALSKAIRLLEDELGVTLLERGRRGVGVKLTTSGETVLEHALTMLAQRERLLFDLDASRQVKKGELRLGLPPLGSAQLFAAPLAEFRERYRGVAIHLREHGGEELEQAIHNNEIELAVTLLPTLTELNALVVHCEPMVLVVPRSHSLATRKKVRLNELAHEAFVTLGKGSALTRILKEACVAQGFEIHEVAQSSQPDFALAMVAAGVGITCLPRLIASHYENTSVQLVDLDAPGMEWRVVVVWRRGSELSWAAWKWIESVKAGATSSEFSS